jgi:dTDP-4-dehydrorhamnose reductase
MRVYLTGADGMLGTALRAALAAQPGTAGSPAQPDTAGWPVLGVSIADFDIGDESAVAASIADFAPDVVVHTAAHAVVDACETEPARALRVNVAGTYHVAQACRRHGSRLVYISSDYVFDGRAPGPAGYREDDVPNPVSVYGLTKLAGERITATVPDHLVVRTSWLYGGTDPRLDQVRSAVDVLLAGGRPGLIYDQFSSPTNVVDLAAALVRLLPGSPAGRGVLHVANRGRASWYQVGRALAERLGGAEPVPVAMDDAGFIGGRPRDSHLDTARAAAFVQPMPHWTDALDRYCAQLGAIAYRARLGAVAYRAQPGAVAYSAQLGAVAAAR